MKLYDYHCDAVFWKLRRRQIAEIPLGLARADAPESPPQVITVRKYNEFWGKFHHFWNGLKKEETHKLRKKYLIFRKFTAKMSDALSWPS